jgi:hypothetical protein
MVTARANPISNRKVNVHKIQRPVARPDERTPDAGRKKPRLESPKTFAHVQKLDGEATMTMTKIASFRVSCWFLRDSAADIWSDRTRARCA